MVLTRSKLREPMAAGLVVLVLGAILLEATPAAANYLSTQWRWTYTSTQDCAKNYNELSHDSTYPGGTYQNAVEQWMNSTFPVFGGYNCFKPHDTILKSRVRVWVWKSSGTPTVKPSGGYWAVCVDYGPFQSGSIGRYVVGLKFGSIPCGYHYYTSDGWGQEYWNSTWHGGWVQLWNYSSQWYHYLPAS